MYDYVKFNNEPAAMHCRPVVVHAVLMSIIFEHYKQLTRLMNERNVKDKAKELTSNTLDLCLGSVICKASFRIIGYKMFEQDY